MLGGIVESSPSLVEFTQKEIHLSAATTKMKLLVTFLIPISALILGISILGERLAPQHFLAMVLIAMGLAAIDGRLLVLIVQSFECWQSPEPVEWVEDHQIYSRWEKR